MSAPPASRNFNIQRARRISDAPNQFNNKLKMAVWKGGRTSVEVSDLQTKKTMVRRLSYRQAMSFRDRSRAMLEFACPDGTPSNRSEEHTSELQSPCNLV